MSRPPWVWNSAPVTLTAKYGAASARWNTRPSGCGPIRRKRVERGLQRRPHRSRCTRPAAPRVSQRAQRAGRLGLAEIGEPARQREQRRIEHVPGDAARLRQHLHRGLGIALGLVVEAPALAVELHAAFHHHGPGHQRALRRDPGAVALVAAQVAQPRAQRPAPEDGAAVVADVAAEGGVAPSRAAARAPSPRCRRSRCRRAAARRRRCALRGRRAGGSRCRSRGPRRRATASRPAPASAPGCRPLPPPPASAAISAAPVFCGSAVHAMHAVARVEKAVEQRPLQPVRAPAAHRAPGRSPRCRPAPAPVPRGRGPWPGCRRRSARGCLRRRARAARACRARE